MMAAIARREILDIVGSPQAGMDQIEERASDAKIGWSSRAPLETSFYFN
jgi:hypothetical protein